MCDVNSLGVSVSDRNVASENVILLLDTVKYFPDWLLNVSGVSVRPKNVLEPCSPPPPPCGASANTMFSPFESTVKNLLALPDNEPTLAKSSIFVAPIPDEPISIHWPS